MIKNSVNRYIPKGFIPFQGSKTLLDKPITLVDEVLSNNQDKQVLSLSDLFDILKIHDGMTLSFHHHLRNGDAVFNMVLDEIKRRDLKDMVLAPSSIFPNNDRKW